MENKNVLIVERSNFQLLNKAIQNAADGKKYIVLEGIFGVLNQKNRNNRIYTADQYLPQVERLQEKINTNKLLGELNHPKTFDIDLNAVSHVIEELYYDETQKQIKGKIRLLNTPSGLIAQSLVSDGIPLHISSRAAGSVNSDGTVTMKHLFTYDLVAEPGFEQAELTRVNEKYGCADLDNIAIYEMDDTVKLPADVKTEEDIEDAKEKEEKDNIYNKKEEMNYITQEQFNKYTEYLKSTFSELNEKIETISQNDNSELDDTHEKTEEQSEKIEELEEKINQLIGFTNYLSENLSKSISHGDHVVENVMEMKVFVDYLTKNLDKTIGYTKYLGENVDNLISHNNHIATMANKNINYSEHIAESVNNLMNEVENNRMYAEYVAEGADKGIQYAEYVANKLDEGIQYSESIGKIVNETANYTNYLAENINKSIGYTEYVAKEASNELPQMNENLQLDNNYEGSILNKLDSIMNEAKRQEAGITNNKLHFLQFLDGDRTKIFSSLNEANKLKVIEAFDKNSYYSTADAISIFENALTKKEAYFISNMKPYHREMWNNLNESKKELIFNQAKNYILETQSQIDNFWDMMDLRNEKLSLESINENEQKDKLKSQRALGLPSDNYMKQFEEAMMNRM
jgi:hypothetical protein